MNNSFIIEHIEFLVTANEKNEVFTDATIVVKDGVIVAINPDENELKNYGNLPVISGRERAITPGLINAHTHLPMVLLRGLAEGVDLDGFLNIVWKAEAEVMTPENCELGGKLGAAESLLGGTTSALDMYFHPTATHKGAVDAGLRHVIGPIFFDFPALDGLEWDQRITLAKEWPAELAKIGGAHIPLYYMPHSCYTDSPEHLAEVANLAQETGANIHLHVSETRQENKTVAEMYNLTPTQQCYETGILNRPTTFGHGVHLSAEDVDMAVVQKAVVAHCPGSNLKLASGIANTSFYYQSALTVALGTDGASSSNDLNMWFVLRLAALLIAQTHGPETVDLHQLFASATREGAKAVGMADRIGSIEVGKEADIISIDLTALHLTPNHDIMALLFYAVNKSDVCDVWVNGEQVVKDRTLVKVDATKLRAEVKNKIDQLKLSDGNRNA
jgi:5-methylthioadenosine/S-adenosylhomocysteine deaminase